MNDNTENKYVGSNAVYEETLRTRQLVAEMNTGWHDEAEVREYLRQITRKEIDGTVRVFPPLNINYGPGVTLGRDCFLNFGCTLLSLGGITIEDDVFIGENAIVAAGSVVTKDVPDNCVAVGTPARIVKQITRNAL